MKTGVLMKSLPEVRDRLIQLLGQHGSAVRCLASASRNTLLASADLLSQLEGFHPTAIVFFASHGHDGIAIGGSLARHFPSAGVIGCTTSGDFGDSGERGTTAGGVTGLAFDATNVRRAFARMARYDEGAMEPSITTAAGALAGDAGLRSLRDADPDRYAAIVLLGSVGASDEHANEVLRKVAPMLSFVGGSAGTALHLESTRVFVGGEEAAGGAALLLLEGQPVAGVRSQQGHDSALAGGGARAV